MDMSDFEWQTHAAFDHGDGKFFRVASAFCTHDLQVHAGPSAGHHTYDSYPNTQGNADFELEQPVQQYDGPGSQFSAGGHLEVPTHDSGHLNGIYLVYN